MIGLLEHISLRKKKITKRNYLNQNSKYFEIIFCGVFLLSISMWCLCLKYKFAWYVFLLNNIIVDLRYYVYNKGRTEKNHEAHNSECLVSFKEVHSFVHSAWMG